MLTQRREGVVVLHTQVPNLHLQLKRPLVSGVRAALKEMVQYPGPLLVRHCELLTDRCLVAQGLGQGIFAASGLLPEFLFFSLADASRGGKVFDDGA